MVPHRQTDFVCHDSYLRLSSYDGEAIMTLISPVPAIYYCLLTIPLCTTGSTVLQRLMVLQMAHGVIQHFFGGE